jgi:hypothetical protein
MTTPLIKKVFKTVINFCTKFVPMTDTSGSAVAIKKLDTTVDMAGSFLPPTNKLARVMIKAKLQALITQMVADGEFKFFSGNSIEDPVVKDSDDCLSTCLKFEVMDKQGFHIMTVKVYDKVLSLIGKDGYRLVGSEIKKVIGSTHDRDVLQQKI